MHPDDKIVQLFEIAKILSKQIDFAEIVKIITQKSSDLKELTALLSKW